MKIKEGQSMRQEYEQDVNKMKRRRLYVTFGYMTTRRIDVRGRCLNKRRFNNRKT